MIVCKFDLKDNEYVDHFMIPNSMFLSLRVHLNIRRNNLLLLPGLGRRTGRPISLPILGLKGQLSVCFAESF